MRPLASFAQPGLFAALLALTIAGCGPANVARDVPTAQPNQSPPTTPTEVVPTADATAAPTTTTSPSATTAPATTPAASTVTTAEPSSDATPQASGSSQRIVFAPGATSAVVEGAVVRGTEDHYILAAQAGQTMQIGITALEDNAVFAIYGPDEQAIAGAEPGGDATEWTGTLPAAGDYQIVVGPTRGNATYRLEVTITSSTALNQPIRSADWQAVLASTPELQIEQFDGRPYVSVVDADPPVSGHPAIDEITYVDLNNDGIEEAAIPLDSGGTAGNIGLLIFRHATPAPLLVAWKEGYKLGLRVEQGRLVVTNPLYAGWEPNCCPSGRSYDTYVLQGDQLQLVAHRDEGFAQAQPETVRRFYELIRQKDLQAAYAMLSDAEQAANPYDTWAAGYASMVDLEANVAADPAQPNTVRVELRATDQSSDGGQVVRRFAGTWQLEWSGTRPGWVMAQPRIQAVP